MQIQISSQDLYDILYAKDATIFEKIFVVDGFSFTKDEHFDYLDNIEKGDPDGILNYYKKLGCIIKGNDIIFPGDLTFKIIKKVHPDEPNTAFEITRNGENFPIVMWDPSEEINAELTKFGEKLDKFAQDTCNWNNYPYVYDLLQQVDATFGTHITGD